MIWAKTNLDSQLKSLYKSYCLNSKFDMHEEKGKKRKSYLPDFVGWTVFIEGSLPGVVVTAKQKQKIK